MTRIGDNTHLLPRSPTMPKSYDRAYFDKWYRDPKHKIISNQTLQRKVRMALSMAEFHLQRPVSNVLDIGCGEGVWQPILAELRPDAEYLGFESSEYAVRRYGMERNIRPLTFGQLGELRLDHRYDLVICADVLHYLRGAEVERGLPGLVANLAGMAYIELYTSQDETVGDNEGFLKRPTSWYREQFRRVGLVGCGSHCYLAPELGKDASQLERWPDVH